MNSKRELIFYLILIGLLLLGTVPLLTRHHTIPVLKSDVWPKFKTAKASCNIDKHTWKMRCEIAYPPEVQALDTKPMTLDGFIMPLEAAESFHHFMLSARAPSCPYCPPGGPNEMIEVFSKAPMRWTDQAVAMHGTLKLMQPQNETGIFFQLLDADNNVAYVADDNTTPIPSAPFGKAIKDYRFVELEDLNQRLTTLQSWAGQPMVVAFWRSDCPPCLNELKILKHLATQHPSLPVALISLQDAAHAHVPPMPANVHILIAQADGKELLTAFGNDKLMALPYSVMLNADTTICQKHNGIITPEILTQWLKLCTRPQ